MRRLTALAVATSATVAAAAVLCVGSVAGARTASSGSSLPVLKLTVSGQSVKVSGSKVSGAVTVQTTVKKGKSAEPTLFAMNPGVTLPDVGKCIAMVNKHHGDLNYLDPCGRLTFDAVAPKGTSTAQTLLRPGNYLALNTQSHSANVKPTQFSVTRSMSPAKLPKPGATIATIEFAFRGPDTLHRGELVRFVNEGFLVHMDVFGRAKNVRDAKKAIKLLLAGKDRAANKLLPSQGTFAGPLSSGGLQQLVVNEKPGVYVQACFMNTQDGREHTQLGMERMFFIKK